MHVYAEGNIIIILYNTAYIRRPSSEPVLHSLPTPVKRYVSDIVEGFTFGQNVKNSSSTTQVANSGLKTLCIWACFMLMYVVCAIYVPYTSMRT